MQASKLSATAAIALSVLLGGAAPRDGATLHPAQATPTNVDITGSWSFQTEPYGLDCRMNGTMTIAASRVEGVYSCALLAEETCGGETWNARQSCMVVRRSTGLFISSRVEEVEGNPGAYLPDDFLLTSISNQQMRGELRSAAIAPVIFIRAVGAIS